MASTKARSPRRSGRVAASIYESLRMQILEGELAPDTHLSHQSLARQMKSSNGPVISALRKLANEGLVTHEDGQGCRVAAFDDKRMEDWLVMRRALETEAIRLATRQATPSDIELLRAMTLQMMDAVRKRDRARGDALDLELHTAIAQLSQSPGLIEALNRCHVQDLIKRRWVRHYLPAKERFEDFLQLTEHHLALVDSIATGDEELAAKAMHEHLSR